MESGGVEWDAVVLAGGTARRLDGTDKATLDLAGRSLLTRALGVVDGARSVVVVGDPVASPRAVVFTREVPAYGGPVAAAYAGLDALVDPAGVVVVLAVDMPGVTQATVARLLAAVGAGDGAVLSGGGRRHLALALRTSALERARPERTEGVAVRALTARLDLGDVPAVGDEATDLDTWEDLGRWREELTKVLASAGGVSKMGPVNLHDWIDECCDVLDIDTEVDEALILDLAKVVADNVERPAAPVTAYLLGYAAGSQDADPEGTERLAAKAQKLAEGWDRPADAPDSEDAAVTVEVPDDSTVDHSADRFDDADPDA